MVQSHKCRHKCFLLLNINNNVFLYLRFYIFILLLISLLSGGGSYAVVKCSHAASVSPSSEWVLK